MEEEDELKTLFATDINNRKCPGKSRIEFNMNESLQNYGQIHKRPRDNIKKKLSNMIIKLRKLEDM